MSAATDLRQHYARVRTRLWMPPKRFWPKKVYDHPIGPDRPYIPPPAMSADMARIYDSIAMAMTVRRIMAEVSERHGVSITEIKGEVRHTSIVAARFEAIYRLRTETTWSYPRIGMYLGGRDHTSCMHAVRQFKKRHGIA